MLKYHEDLAPYQDGKLAIQEVLAVGWLDNEHVFPTGKVTPELITKLKEILVHCNNYPCYVSVHVMKGEDKCPICSRRVAFMVDDGSTLDCRDEIIEISESERSEEIEILGCREIWIPNINKEKNYFATLDLIYHFIIDHQYLPPQDFIESILAFDIKSDFIAEKEYANCVRKYFPDFISVAEMLEQDYGIIP
jgi:hypothetical protein